MCLPMANQALPEPPADAGHKQKKKRIQRDFQKPAQWEHDEHREDDIEDLIRSELKIVTAIIVPVLRSGMELTSNETIAMVFL